MIEWFVLFNVLAFAALWLVPAHLNRVAPVTWDDEPPTNKGD